MIDFTPIRVYLCGTQMSCQQIYEEILKRFNMNEL